MLVGNFELNPKALAKREMFDDQISSNILPFGQLA